MKVPGATRPLLPLAAVTAGLASGSVLAAEWTVTPSADLLMQSQQNPGLSSDEAHKHDVSNGVGATLAVGVQRRTERTALSLAPTIRAYRYSNSRNFDRDEGGIGASYSSAGETVSWTTSANASRDTTLTSELGSTGITEGNLRHETWGASVGPTWSLSERWRMQSTLETNASRYPDRQNSLSNYRYSTAIVGATHVVDEQLLVTVYGTAGKLDSQGNGADTNDKSANLQLQYAWSPLTSLGGSIGQSWVTSGGVLKKGLVYNASLSHVFEKSSLGLSASRRHAPSGLALLTEADEVRLGFATQITERLSASASASYSKRRNVLRMFDIDLQTIQYTTASLGLSWVMTPNLRVGFNASRSTQRIGSDFLAQDRTGRGYEAHVGLSWNGDPYVR